METTTQTKDITLEEAKQVIVDKEITDINSCVAEINQVMAEQVNPILTKYGCFQTFRISGQGNHMEVQQIILKQK